MFFLLLYLAAITAGRPGIKSSTDSAPLPPVVIFACLLRTYLVLPLPPVLRIQEMAWMVDPFWAGPLPELTGTVEHLLLLIRLIRHFMTDLVS